MPPKAQWRRRLLGVWLEVRVIPVLLWSFTAITLGTALAWRDGDGGSPALYLAAVVVGVLLQGLVAHCANDVVDWRSGTDADPSPRTLSGGSKVVPAGLLTTGELRVVAVVAALAATGLGLLVAARHGWVLVAFGVGGLLGALVYSLPPVRAAYRPIAGELVALVCVWGCTAGAYVLQRGTLTAAAVVAGAGYAAACVSMLQVHHYNDRTADDGANPRKRTSVLVLGGRAHGYSVAWAAAAAALFLALGLAGEPAFLLAAALSALSLAPQAMVSPADPASVTRSELAVIALVMAAGLSTSVVLAPDLAWTLLAPLVLVPLELRIARVALGPPPSPRIDPPAVPPVPENT